MSRTDSGKKAENREKRIRVNYEKTHPPKTGRGRARHGGQALPARWRAGTPFGGVVGLGGDRARLAVRAFLEHPPRCYASWKPTAPKRVVAARLCVVAVDPGFLCKGRFSDLGLLNRALILLTEWEIEAPSIIFCDGLDRDFKRTIDASEIDTRPGWWYRPGHQSKPIP